MNNPIKFSIHLPADRSSSDIDWSDIAADDAAERTGRAQGTIPSDGNDVRARLRRLIKRRRVGNVIRKMLSVKMNNAVN